MVTLKTIRLIFAGVLVFLSAKGLAGNIQSAELQKEAIDIVKTFAGELKPKLKSAIQEGGLVNAIEVCSAEAPRIANQLSEETGWTVKRVSLKARNDANAVPDEFERMVLTQFNERQAMGESVETIKHSAIVGHEYRFMKAQGVEGVCLSCHGSSLPAEVKQALSERYPNDQATGYSLGEIRGAFSLTKPL